MRPSVSLVGPACLAAALVGCQQQADDPSGTAGEAACADPGEAELGLPTMDVPAMLTTTAGRLRFRVTGMNPDALIPIDTTSVFLGEAGTLPHRDAQRPEWPDNASYRTTVSLDEAGYVDVDAGSYWVSSSAGGRIHVAGCPDVTISDVAPVMPDPGAGFGVPSSG